MAKKSKATASKSKSEKDDVSESAPVEEETKEASEKVDEESGDLKIGDLSEKEEIEIGNPKAEKKAAEPGTLEAKVENVLAELKKGNKCWFASTDDDEKKEVLEGVSERLAALGLGCRVSKVHPSSEKAQGLMFRPGIA